MRRRGNKRKFYIQWHGEGQVPSNLTSVIRRPVIQVLVAASQRRSPGDDSVVDFASQLTNCGREPEKWVFLSAPRSIASNFDVSHALHIGSSSVEARAAGCRQIVESTGVALKLVDNEPWNVLEERITTTGDCIRYRRTAMRSADRY